MRTNRAATLWCSLLLLSPLLTEAKLAIAQTGEEESPIVAVGRLERKPGKPGSGSPCSLKVSSIDRKPPGIELKAGDALILVGDRAKNCKSETPVRVSGVVAGLGDHVTLQATRIDPVNQPGGAPTPLALTAGLNTAALSQRLAAAELVIQGRVMAIRNAPLIAAAGGRPGPITEHDPQWKEAVVQVVATVKGNAPPTVIVRFPGSRDIAFREFPKFHVGQDATLLLSPDQISGAGPHIEAAGARAYVAQTSADVLPPHTTERLKQLMHHE